MSTRPATETPLARRNLPTWLDISGLKEQPVPGAPAVPLSLRMKDAVTGPCGSFRYTCPTESWWWSDDVYRIHGFEPGDVVPTTDLLFAHTHPDDLPTLNEVWCSAVNGQVSTAFASYHRVVDARRHVRHVVLVGEAVLGPDRVTDDVRGYLVDMSVASRMLTAREVDEAVRRSAMSRGAIEQTKGVLMAALGVDETTAFEMLRRHSQNANIKVRELAHTLLASLAEARAAGVDAVTVVRKVLGYPKATAG
jgi:hypothetical protein